MEKIKVEFNPKGVIATLINRVYRSGIAIMASVDKAKNKGESVDQNMMEDQSNDFLLSSFELENMVLSQLAQKNKEPWTVFVDAYSKLKDEEKPLFKGVVQDVKKAASNVLSGIDNPFEDIGSLPYIPSVVPFQQVVNYPPSYYDAGVLWEEIFNDTEKMEVSNKYTHEDIDKVAEVIIGAGGVAVAVGRPETGGVVAGVGVAIIGVNTAMEMLADYYYGN